MNKTKLNKKKHACSLGPEGGRKRAGHPRVIMLLPPTGGSLEDLGSLGRLWEWGLGWKGGLGEGPMGLERPKGTSTHKESAPFYSTNLNSSKTKTKKQKQKTNKWNEGIRNVQKAKLFNLASVFLTFLSGLKLKRSTIKSFLVLPFVSRQRGWECAHACASSLHSKGDGVTKLCQTSTMHLRPKHLLSPTRRLDSSSLWYFSSLIGLGVNVV